MDAFLILVLNRVHDIPFKLSPLETNSFGDNLKEMSNLFRGQDEETSHSCCLLIANSMLKEYERTLAPKL